MSITLEELNMLVFEYQEERRKNNYDTIKLENISNKMSINMRKLLLLGKIQTRYYDIINKFENDSFTDIIDEENDDDYTKYLKNQFIQNYHK